MNCRAAFYAAVRMLTAKMTAYRSMLKNRKAGVTCRLIFRANQSMSQHRSLKGASTIAAKRNVLKRFERVELLKKRGQWKEGSKVVGLPKTKPDV